MNTKKYILLTIVLSIMVFFTSSVSLLAQGLQQSAVLQSNVQVEGITLQPSNSLESSNSATFKSISGVSRQATIEIKAKDSQPGQGLASSSSLKINNNTTGAPVKIKKKENKSLATVQGGTGIIGKVISKTDKSITIISEEKSNQGKTINYVIDISKAKFVVKGVDSPSISDVEVGDNVSIQGTITGSSIVALFVVDQKKDTIAGSENTKKDSGFWRGIANNVSNFFKYILGF